MVVAKRSFTVVNMTKYDGCPTKFTGGRYTGRTPAAAARKALSYHCAVKRIRGRCALYIKLRETTRGSNNKHFTYLLHRVKLAEPLVRFAGQPNEFKIRYTTDVKSVKSIPTCRSGRVKTRGRMRSRHARKY
tara:strand:+ start:607 stop:1002 length:396 start_codon:yes stop_codon:yes gene_type:complete